MFLVGTCNGVFYAVSTGKHSGRSSRGYTQHYHVPRHLLKRNEGKNLHEIVHMKFCSGVIPDSPKVEATQMIMYQYCIFKSRMPFIDTRGYYLAIRQGGISKLLCWRKEGRHKRPHVAWFRLFETAGRGKSADTKQVKGCQEWGDGRMESGCWWPWGFFSGWWNVLASVEGMVAQPCERMKNYRILCLK